MARKLFCQISPLCYEISLRKEHLKRHLQNLFCVNRFARLRDTKPLANIVKSHSSILVRKLYSVDPRLQENKIVNLRIACDCINGLLIRPGETFSFWKMIGKTSAKRGFVEGLVISDSRLTSGIGGGLCQMGNMIHWLVLNSPLTVTELHHHSDALFPDERRRVPFGTGTSVCYNHIDYRFRNDTDQTVQLLTWIDGDSLCGELRSERPFPCRYRLVEEDHHFRREGEDYYRISRVYRLLIDRKTGQQLDKELILDNHSLVMYDHSLIPKEQIRNEDP